MTTSDKHYQTLPISATPPNGDEVENRARLVKRYNCLVGTPGKITCTIQKQFLMGFMSKDEVDALRSVYKCVISAMESAIRLQGTDSAQP